MYDQLHDALPFHDGTWTNWSKTASAQTPYRYDDGVTIWVAPEDYAPEDDFLNNSTETPHDDEEV